MCLIPPRTCAAIALSETRVHHLTCCLQKQVSCDYHPINSRRSGTELKVAMAFIFCSGLNTALRYSLSTWVPIIGAVLICLCSIFHTTFPHMKQAIRPDPSSQSLYRGCLGPILPLARCCEYFSRGTRYRHGTIVIPVSWSRQLNS
jgi:hypothetical protein